MISSIPKSNLATEARINHTNETNLVALSSTNRLFDHLKNLHNYFDDNDVIIVNDSAVIPGSFQGYHYPSNEQVELRLARHVSDKMNDFRRWEAIVYGFGNWKTPTENRLPPPDIQVGDFFIFEELVAEVISTSLSNNRLLTIQFQEDNNKLLSKIYKYGKLIQYSYLQDDLHLWDHQTIFSSYPVSVEPSSSLFQLNWKLIEILQHKGVEIIPMTHSISISNTGISEIDKNLPLAERYWLSEYSAERLNVARENNKQFIAFGTSMTRALESMASSTNRFQAGTKKVDLVIDKNYSLKITKGLLTGMHMIDSSHINLLQAFLPLDVILTVYHQAIDRKFLWEEHGDSMLIKNFKVGSVII